MEEIITKDNLDTYTQGLKGVLSSMGEAINNNSAIDSVEDKIDNIQTDVTAIKTAVTTPQVSSGCTVTVTINGGNGQEYVTVTSGSAAIASHVADGGTFVVPIGAKYTISHKGFRTGSNPGDITKTAETVGYSYIVEASYVDLGLPSGKVWGTFNIGSSSQDGYGNYFMWGDNYGQSKHSGNWAQSLTESNYKSGSYGQGYTLTTNIPSTYEYDAAVCNSNGRIPTVAEWLELINNCTWTHKNTYLERNVYGFEITGPSGRKMFLPDAGYVSDGTYYSAECYYWTSNIENHGGDDIYGYYFYGSHSGNNNNSLSTNYDVRWYAKPIRPIITS